MDKEKTQIVVNNQREYYLSGATLPVEARKQALQALKSALMRHEDDIYNALHKDLLRPKMEAYMAEFHIVISEIEYFLKNIDKLNKRKRCPSPIEFFKSTSYMYPEPYGVVLIISPWNYPIQLTLAPLIGAVAAGNCVMVKPSEYTLSCAAVIETIVSEVFDARHVAVVRGNREANAFLLQQKYDYIFFTGSFEVGKVVMRAAAEHLTPVTLELGGKSPCIVDETADLDKSAKRIVFGKIVNAGQTCVAPDYILVHQSVRDAFIDKLKKHIVACVGEHAQTSDSYTRIVNRKHFDRLKGLMENEHKAFGGYVNEDTLQISPTILDEVSWDSSVMKEEIFGPLLPVLTYTDLDKTIDHLNTLAKPLAFYYFTRDKKRELKVMRKKTYGGGCVNDTIIHAGTHHMPFGGVGESGMGGYHGKASFDTFSHYKSVVKKSLVVDLPVRFAPYTEKKFKLVRAMTLKK
ncbi:MAG TPA: aldehyde dehydrogenase, partial [Clostridia bacterium]|nr:aldehyde dehydrogenase [Clostridia bacterium]